MLDTMRLYARFVGISMRSQMQYRASFVMLSIGNFAAAGIEFLGLWALFDRFGRIGTLAGGGQWGMAEVALLYGMASLSFALAEAWARGFDTFDRMVKSGEFDRILLRPRSTVLQIVGREVQLMRIGRFAQGVIVLAWATSSLDVAWTAGKAALVLVSILGGASLFSGLFVLQATIAFWTTESLEVMNAFTYGGMETAQYPLTIYPAWFRRFFTYVVPLACLNYFPSLAILDRPDPLGTPAVWHWISPSVGLVFLLAALKLWQVGVRHYRSTGS